MKRFKPLQYLLDEFAGAPFPKSGYHEFIFQWDREFFIERIDMVGFKGGERVLDAGCGLGQFSYALAQFNDEVVAIDRLPESCEVTRMLIDRWRASNVTIEQQSLPNLPYNDASFDYVWCSGVLSFVDRPATLKTFHRILRPNGRLYVMTNSWGQWLYKAALAHAQGQMTARDSSLRALMSDSTPSGALNFIDPSQIVAVCNRAGFRLIASGSDGSIDLSGKERSRPMFPAFHTLSQESGPPVQLTGNIEFVAEKS